LIYKHRIFAVNFGNMKHILVVLFIFLSFSAFSQNRFPSVDSAKNYVLRYIKNSAVESFTNWRMQNTVYGTLELLDSLAVNAALDSIFIESDTLKYSKGGIIYTVGSLGGVTPTLQQVTTAGNTTSNDIRVEYIEGSGDVVVRLAADGSDGLIEVGNSALSGLVSIQTNTTDSGSISFFKGSNTIKVKSQNATANRTLTLPDTTGNLSVGVSANGTTYMAGTNGITNIGYVDTATVVKAYVHNAESVQINRGQVVYIFSATGDKASVKLANNTSDTFSSKTFAIVRDDIPAGGDGWVTTQGQLSGLNLGSYTAGDILWLDSVPGGFTKTKPVAPKHGVFVGVVERANAGNGIMYVKIQNGVELDELHDVRITSVANNEIIRYNSTLGYWENKSIITTLGYTPLNVTDTTAMLSPYLRSNVAAATYQLQLDTVPLAVFGAGSGAAGDTAAFSTSAVYGSFYNAGSDTLIITQMRAGVLGNSPSITTEVYWNDSLNITAGATILVSGGTSVTGTIGDTNVTSFTNNKIPPNVWVFVRTSAVATKPTYFTLTLLGYKKRI
jgi:hypothetical protein